MQRLHLRNLLKEATRLCDTIPTERPADYDPALTVLIANLGTLSSRLRDIAALAEHIGLPDVSQRMGEHSHRLDDFFGRIVLPIMARGETPEGVAAMLEKYGPFPRNVSPEYHEAEWIQIHGTLAHIRGCVELLSRSIKPKRKRSAPSSANGDTLTPPQDAAMTVAAAAKLLGVGKGVLYKLCKEGEMPHTKIGRRITITPAQIEEYRARPTCESSGLRYV